MRVGRWVALALAALVASGLASCGGDDDGADDTADVGRYCELTAELEQAAEQHFAQLDQGATRADFEQAHVEFIDQNEATIEELPEVAPEAIRGDVETVLSGMRAQAGEEVEVSEAGIEAADQRLRQFEKESC